MIAPRGPDSLLVIVPALNEEGAIAGVVRSINREMPGVPVLVIDDYSTDATVARAKEAGAAVVSLPRHLGLGGCVQTGYKLAFELGFDYVVRVDGDGQHDARDIRRIYETLLRTGANMVIGSRYIVQDGEPNGKHTSPMRGLGIVFFRFMLRVVLGKPVHDPTSGFVGVNRTALQVFSRTFPLEYPEIEALVVLQRRRFRFEEVPCRMLPRTTGRSSITPMQSVYYIIHVLLGIAVNVLKYDARRPPENPDVPPALFHQRYQRAPVFAGALFGPAGAHSGGVLRGLALRGDRIICIVAIRMASGRRGPDAAYRAAAGGSSAGVFGVFLLLFFWASILISQLRDDTIALVQRIAILEFQVNHLKENGKSGADF